MSPFVPFFFLSPVVAGGLAFWMLRRIGAKREQRARGALDGLAAQLRGHKAPGALDLQVRDVSWSGDLEVAPHHCQVRVVMGGVDAREIPSNFYVEGVPGAPRPPAEVHTALRALDAEVMNALQGGGWTWQRPVITYEPEAGAPASTGTGTTLH